MAAGVVVGMVSLACVALSVPSRMRAAAGVMTAGAAAGMGGLACPAPCLVCQKRARRAKWSGVTVFLIFTANY